MPRPRNVLPAKKKGKPARKRPVPLSVEMRIREARLYKVDDVVGDLLTEGFKTGRFRERFRFDQGATVLCLSNGLYHEAIVSGVGNEHLVCISAKRGLVKFMACEMTVDIRSRSHCTVEDDLLIIIGALLTYFHSVIPSEESALDRPEDWIPTVMVAFPGYSAKYNEEIPENELISCIPNELCHVQGMLFAHEWNMFHRDRLGFTNAQMGRSTWFFPDGAQHGELERMWQDASGYTISFAEYCGRKEVAADETIAIKLDTHSVKALM